MLVPLFVQKIKEIEDAPFLLQFFVFEQKYLYCKNILHIFWPQSQKGQDISIKLVSNTPILSQTDMDNQPVKDLSSIEKSMKTPNFEE